MVCLIIFVQCIYNVHLCNHSTKNPFPEFNPHYAYLVGQVGQLTDPYCDTFKWRKIHSRLLIQFCEVTAICNRHTFASRRWGHKRRSEQRREHILSSFKHVKKMTLSFVLGIFQSGLNQGEKCFWSFLSILKQAKVVISSSIIFVVKCRIW